MAKIDLPYEIVNDSPGNAVPVQSNFSRVEQHINAEVIERDGTVAMNAQLRLAGNPVNALDAAPKQYVDTVIPIGGILMFGGTAAPVGGLWLLCDGSPYEAAAYPALYAVIGTRFGGSGGFFNTPPLTQRMPMGADGTVITVGKTGGNKDLVLPAHTHPIAHSHGNVSSTDTNHVHGAPDHSHPVNIGGGTDAQGSHMHNFSNNPDPGQANGVMLTASGPSSFTFGNGGTLQAYATYTVQPQIIDPAGQHSHNVSVGGNSGTVNGGPGTTGWMDRASSHVHAVPAIDANTLSGSTGAGVAAGTDLNLPPYVGVAFLIRAA